MQKRSLVVCINDSNWNPRAIETMSALPVKNRIYTVRKIINTQYMGDLYYEPGISLVGIYGQMDFFETTEGTVVFEEYCFRISRFAEVHTNLQVHEEDDSNASEVIECITHTSASRPVLVEQ